MRINDLSKELGVTNKEIIAFLKEIGSESKHHSNSINPDEEQRVREKFESKESKAASAPKTMILRKKEDAPDRSESDESSSATTIIRRGSKRKRSFIPEDERERIAESQPFDSLKDAERMEDSNDRPLVSGVEPQEEIEEEKPEQTEAAAEIEQDKKDEKENDSEIMEDSPKHHKLSVEEEARILAEQELREKKEEKPIEELSGKEEDDEKNRTRKPDVDDKEEDDDKGRHKKKKKVVIPEGDSSSSQTGFPERAKGPRKRRGEPTGPSAKVKGKIKGGDISNLIDDNSSARDLARRNRRMMKKKKKEPVAPANPTKAIKKICKLEDTVIVSELAKMMGVKASQLISKLMAMGELVGINDRIPYDTASLLVEEFGFQSENVTLSEETYIEVREEKEENLVSRPPVVTVMGHVDHGKTKLLDSIRDTNVVDKEAGGITQHIGAYSIEVGESKITFLDTPGHEAFTAMRSRGASATDVVILIVAADDGVMPQTVEAINHAKAAGVPIIVAINKIDKPDASPQKVKNELLKYEIISEDLGGEHLFVEISAKERINIDGLLEAVLLQVEMMDLKADPTRQAEGIVIESKMDQGRGPVATVLVKNGTLKIGDVVVSGTSMGFVRSMIDWTRAKLTDAGPSMAVEITGLDSVPPAGEKLHVFKDEKKAKGLIDLRCNKIKERKFERDSKMSLENLYAKMESGDIQDVNIVVKADVDGSVEAIISSLSKIEHKKMNLKVLHSGVGGITENDVLLASASNAIIVGFNVRIDNKAKLVATSEQVDIRIFSIIYELIDSVKAAMTGMLAPIIKEEFIGKLEVRDVFKVGKVGTIAGCMVIEGKILKKSRAKVVRNNVVIYESAIANLKRFKDDVKEVKNGYECGASIENFNDIKVGDIIECYVNKEIKDEVV
jgi:translation initiation factor IF-2